MFPQPRLPALHEFTLPVVLAVFAWLAVSLLLAQAFAELLAEVEAKYPQLDTRNPALLLVLALLCLVWPVTAAAGLLLRILGPRRE